MKKSTKAALCYYPGCRLDEEHEGDHDFSRPAEPKNLRLIQALERSQYWKKACDVDASHGLAAGVYVDPFNFAWELCNACAERGGATSDELSGHRPPDKAVSEVRESAPKRRVANGRGISLVR